MNTPTPPPCIYVCGPMRGIPGFNFPAFDQAAMQLRALGWEVISPAEMDRDDGFDPNAPHSPEEIAGLKRTFMLRDLGAIARHCTAIFRLPGWEKSAGVKPELALAKFLDLLILDTPVPPVYTDNNMTIPDLHNLPVPVRTHAIQFAVGTLLGLNWSSAKVRIGTTAGPALALARAAGAITHSLTVPYTPRPSPPLGPVDAWALGKTLLERCFRAAIPMEGA